MKGPLPSLEDFGDHCQCSVFFFSFPETGWSFCWAHPASKNLLFHNLAFVQRSSGQLPTNWLMLPVLKFTSDS